MYKPDDKDIDRLSRDAAAQYHAPGKPDWSALQQTLDKELPQEKEKKRRGFFFFFFLIIGMSLAGSGVWYGIHSSNKNKIVLHTSATGSTSKKNAAYTHGKSAPAQTSKVTIPAEINLPATVSTVSPGTHTLAKNKHNIAIDSNSKTISLTQEKNNTGSPKLLAIADLNATSSANGSKIVSAAFEKSNAPLKNNNRQHLTILKPKTPLQKNKSVNNKNTAADPQEIKISAVQKIKPSNRPQKNTYKESTGTTISIADRYKPAAKKTAIQFFNLPDDAEVTTDVAANTTSADNINTQNDSNTNSPEKPLFAALADAKADTKTAAKDSIAENIITVTGKKDSGATPKKKDTFKNNKAILLGLTAGLDISTVKLTYGDNAGYNIGFMGGYQFNKHWSVYTGIIYTKKNYKLDGVDFHPPKHYWTQYVKLQTVEGYCRMWEVPLLARYTFNPGQKSSLFVSTGISSYFMKKQQYNYSYKNSMNQYMTGTWGTDSSFNHAFSILHISGGFEKRIGKHMNWQIEPYAKIPFGGVGFGSIRLSSFGINFSVQYRQPIKR